MPNGSVTRSQTWWRADEITHANPNDNAFKLFTAGMREHGLGRKRILDTMLAATYFANDVKSIVSSNAGNFEIFGCFEMVVP